MKPFLLFLTTVLILTPFTFSQRPTHVPGNGEPLRFLESPENVIFYIVLPVIIGVLYFIWRRKLRKEQDAGHSTTDSQTKNNQ